MLIMHLSVSMFSLWQGRSAGMGWEFWYPPKKVNFPLSPEKKWLVKTYKDVKNIKNSPAHKGGYVNQIHTLIDKNKTKKKQPPCSYQPHQKSGSLPLKFINKKHSFWLILNQKLYYFWTQQYISFSHCIEN